MLCPRKASDLTGIANDLVGRIKTQLNGVEFLLPVRSIMLLPL
jgi:hypothetical protein